MYFPRIEMLARFSAFAGTSTELHGSLAAPGKAAQASEMPRKVRRLRRFIEELSLSLKVATTRPETWRNARLWSRSDRPHCTQRSRLAPSPGTRKTLDGSSVESN